jgi:hypothetical protein
MTTCNTFALAIKVFIRECFERIKLLVPYLMMIKHYTYIMILGIYIDSYEFKLSDNDFTFFVGGDAWPIIVQSAALSTLFSLQNQCF